MEMHRAIAGTVLLMASLAARAQPNLAQIVRESINPGNEGAYKAIEDESAQACADLGCPHPYLALEPVNGAKEIWWFNFFASETERQQVTRDYTENVPLMEVLMRNSARKSKLTGEVVDLVLTYRADRSREERWDLSELRFIVVTVGNDSTELEGSIFEAPDGTYLVLQPASTREEAECLAAQQPQSATLLAVRPWWGMPAREWIEADRDFWASNPNAGRAIK